MVAYGRYGRYIIVCVEKFQTVLLTLEFHRDGSLGDYCLYQMKSIFRTPIKRLVAKRTC